MIAKDVVTLRHLRTLVLRRMKITGTALLLLAGLMFLGSFLAGSKHSAGGNIGRCRLSARCDVNPYPGHSPYALLLSFGGTLIFLLGVMVVRSADSASNLR
jgi:hypothetical protein